MPFDSILGLAADAQHLHGGRQPAHIDDGGRQRALVAKIESPEIAPQSESAHHVSTTAHFSSFVDTARRSTLSVMLYNGKHLSFRRNTLCAALWTNYAQYFCARISIIVW